MNKKLPDIKLKQVRFFNLLLQKTETNQFEWIKNEYSNKYSNFQELYSLLLKSKLIFSKENKIQFAPSIENITIDDFLINSLKYSDVSKHVQQYLEAFNILNSQIIYNPTRVEKVKYSNIRNLLIEAGYIKYNTTSNIYYFLPQKYQELKNILIESNSALSPELLKIIKKKQQAIGHNAELAIMDYEKKKLINYPSLQKDLVHVAKYNSSAGYDIRSWSINLGKIPHPKERYIEVKAVSFNVMNFHWSRNEIDKAIEYSTQYYLYLLPVIGDSKFDLSKLMIISNPYSNVFLNDKWDKQAESYSFKLLGTH